MVSRYRCAPKMDKSSNHIESNSLGQLNRRLKQNNLKSQVNSLKLGSSNIFQRLMFHLFESHQPTTQQAAPAAPLAWLPIEPRAAGGRPAARPQRWRHLRLAQRCAGGTSKIMSYPQFLSIPDLPHQKIKAKYMVS